MSENESSAVIEPGQDLEVDFFRPEDAPGVVRLFHMVYGDGYPVKTFTDPVRLIEENESRRVISSVARTTKGDIVGHNALFHSAPFKGTYESGAGLVASIYRGRDIAFRVVEHGLIVVAKELGIETIFGEPVLNHIIMQRVLTKLGFKPCALEVSLMPATTYAQEKSASGRVSTLLDFMIFTPRQQTIYLPFIYEEPLNLIYGGIDHACRFERSSEELPVGQKSRIETTVFDFARVARFVVHEAGRDFGEVFNKEETAVQERGCEVQQVSLKLSWPWVGRVVEILRSRGYFFGGALPRWFDGDGLLMQRVAAAPDWEGMKIHNERAVKIRDFVRADWEVIQQVNHGRA